MEFEQKDLLDVLFVTKLNMDFFIKTIKFVI